MPEVYQELEKEKNSGGGAASTIKKIFLIILIVVYALILAVYAYITIVRISAEGNGNDPVYFGSKLFAVKSASMEPNVPSGSLIVVEVPSSTVEYTKSELIAIKKPDTDGVEAEVFMVLGAASETGETIYSVVDNNQREEAVRSVSISGRVSRYIPVMGNIFSFINSVYGLLVVVIIPLLIILTVFIVRMARGSKDEVSDDEFFASNVEEVQMTETGSLIEPESSFVPEVADVDFNALKKNFDNVQPEGEFVGQTIFQPPVSNYDSILHKIEENNPAQEEEIDEPSVSADEDIVADTIDNREELAAEEQAEEKEPMEDHEMQDAEQVGEAEENTHGIDAYMTEQGLEIDITKLQADRVKFTLVKGGTGLIIEIGEFQAEIDVDLKNL